MIYERMIRFPRWRRILIWHAVRDNMAIFALCAFCVGVVVWIGDIAGWLCGPAVCMWR
jgi:hypothetical protein